MNSNWKKETETAYFREDGAYAGKDHTKNLKTFIAFAPFISDTENFELRGFKSIESAIKTVDKKWS